jgi:hypothetical protein
MIPVAATRRARRVLAACLLLAGAGAAAGQTDPVGVWNLRIRVGNIGEGYRTILVRVERRGDRLVAQASGVTPEFRDVEDFSWAKETMQFATGAYEYVLTVKGDVVTGTVTSPAGRQDVTGTRQRGLGFGGDVPEVLQKEWTGIVGHRVDGVPPAETPDPAAWLRARVKTIDDVVLWQRRVAVGFTNAGTHETTLLKHAGKTVTVAGAWRTDRIEIMTITAGSVK